MQRVKRTAMVSIVAVFVMIGLFAVVGQTAEHGGHDKAAPPHWGYSGEGGPEHWGDLDPNYAACKVGRSQSPINVVTADVAKKDLPKLEFAYVDGPLNVLNNGHAWQVTAEAGSVKVAGAEYKLLQYHFHSPSENQIDGVKYDLEMHLVHKNGDTLLVVGVLFKLSEEDNPALAEVWKNAPEKAGETKTVAGKTINPAALLPTDHAYYHWSGSLTTPPCTEGVQWYLLKQPLKISKAQVEKFLSVIGPNARPVLPLNDRKVVEGN